MKEYLLRRLLMIIPTYLGITIVTFVIIQLAPGSPVSAKLGIGESLKDNVFNRKIIEDTKKLYGLDRPVIAQYFDWLKRSLTFDFGDSFKDNRPVMEKIAERVPVTLQINIIAILAVYLISVPIGVFSAVKHNSLADKAVTVIIFVLYSLPNFWVAILLITFLGGGEYLDIFPIYGLNSYGIEGASFFNFLLDRLWHLVLPVTCLAYAGLASLSRYAKVGMLDVIRQDYILTARAKGLSEKAVIFKHALRNSVIPIVTLLAGLLPAMLGGSVIVESIFSIPGMGKLGFESILARDYPTIMGIVSISALLTLAGFLISDILYAVVDPRISYE
ncbi:MAG: ABC transporter permease [Candidatus Aureabacteria bacterium]|nr:ABC transporter permease [Candidatus Auribacterota bacterium]